MGRRQTMTTKRDIHVIEPKIYHTSLAGFACQTQRDDGYQAMNTIAIRASLIIDKLLTVVIAYGPTNAWACLQAETIQYEFVVDKFSSCPGC